MEKVKRYSLNIDVAMEIDYEGNYVLATDYEALEADCRWAMEHIAELERGSFGRLSLDRAVKWLGEHP